VPSSAPQVSSYSLKNDTRASWSMPTTYVVPDNPADPLAAALELIVRLPGQIIRGYAALYSRLTEALQRPRRARRRGCIYGPGGAREARRAAGRNLGHRGVWSSACGVTMRRLTALAASAPLVPAVDDVDVARGVHRHAAGVFEAGERHRGLRRIGPLPRRRRTAAPTVGTCHHRQPTTMSCRCRRPPAASTIRCAVL
jgi:hypothetical protein